MKIDTLRLLLFWECNLSCDYCCNEIPEIRAGIKEISLENITGAKYENICISGGEPFINPDLVLATAEAFYDKNVFIYSNGLLINQELLDTILENHKNIKGLNIGLHGRSDFYTLIPRLHRSPLVRFHVEDVWKEYMEAYYPKEARFHYWHRNDCEVLNEEVFILK